VKLAPTDTEHPDVLIEAKKIEAAGGFDFVEAFGELTAVLDSLFDGHGDRGYIGASKTADQVFLSIHHAELFVSSLDNFGDTTLA